MKHIIPKLAFTVAEVRRQAQCPYSQALRELKVALGEIHRDRAARFPEWSARVKVLWYLIYGFVS